MALGLKEDKKTMLLRGEIMLHEEANRQLRELVKNQAERIIELEQKLAAKSWLKRFLNWLEI